MRDLDRKEGWALQNGCLWTVVLEKTPEGPLDCTDIKPVNPKGNQPWIVIGRNDSEAEAPILWPPDSKSWPIWKDPDAGKDWGQKMKGPTEHKMVGWHHQLHGHEYEQTPGDSGGQGSLACCSPWGLQSRTWLSDWTTTTILFLESVIFLFYIQPRCATYIRLLRRMRLCTSLLTNYCNGRKIIWTWENSLKYTFLDLTSVLIQYSMKIPILLDFRISLFRKC